MPSPMTFRLVSAEELIHPSYSLTARLRESGLCQAPRTNRGPPLARGHGGSFAWPASSPFSSLRMTDMCELRILKRSSNGTPTASNAPPLVDPAPTPAVNLPLVRAWMVSSRCARSTGSRSGTCSTVSPTSTCLVAAAASSIHWNGSASVYTPRK